MSKKYWLLIGGLIGTLFLLNLILPNQVMAAEGDCHLKNCLVPAPTILMPEEGEVVTTSRPAIRGLTWKRTVVKVYIDGNELTNVIQKDHEDYYASFFVMPQYNLSAGDHYIYTIAHSEKPGWFDQSKESVYTNFSVKKITIAPVIPPSQPPSLPEPSLEPKDSSQTPTEIELPSDVTETEDENLDIISAEKNTNEVEVIGSPIEGDVEIQEGQVEGGVSIEKKAEVTPFQEAAGLSDLGEILKDEFVAKEQADNDRRNRTIGLVMLALVLVVTIVWLALSRQHKIKDSTVGKKEGELPPPPQPPKNRVVQKEITELKDEEITVEPIQEEDLPPMPPISEDDEREYWASPPPSPYSPYPTTEDPSAPSTGSGQADSVQGEVDIERKDKQDDLGI